MAGSSARVPDLLRASGLRCTPQRTSVLRVLVRARRPLSHGQLAEALGAGEIDRVTLYRTLAALQEAGLVHRTQDDRGVWRFGAHAARRGACPGDHPHFACTKCGGMRCLEDQALPWITVSKGELILGKQLVAYGVCARCAAPPAPARVRRRKVPRPR